MTGIDPTNLLTFPEEESEKFETLHEVRHAFRNLAPLIEAANNRHLELNKRNRRLREEAGMAISAVTEKQIVIKEIRLSRPAGTTELGIIKPRCTSDMWDALGFERADQLERLFDRYIWHPYMPACWNGVGKWCWKSIGAKSWDYSMDLNRRVTLLYMGFTLAGAKDKMINLSRWVKLMTRAFPLGPDGKNPNAWYITVR